MIVFAPGQIVGGAEVVTFGNGFTVTTTVCVALVHPAVVPVKVYVVVAAGETVTGEPESEPGIQL
jgi:hypothetical protein